MSNQLNEFDLTAPVFVPVRDYPSETALYWRMDALSKQGYIKHWSERLQSFVFLHASRWEVPAMGDPHNLHLFDLEMIAHSRTGEPAHRMQSAMRRALDESAVEIEMSGDLNRWVRRIWDGSEMLAGKYGPSATGR